MSLAMQLNIISANLFLQLNKYNMTLNVKLVAIIYLIYDLQRAMTLAGRRQVANTNLNVH